MTEPQEPQQQQFHDPQEAYYWQQPDEPHKYPWYLRSKSVVLMSFLGVAAVLLIIAQVWSPPQGSLSSSSGVDTSKVLASGNSVTKTMTFEECNAAIRDTAGELGVAPINIAETSSLRIVRFPATDASVMITCSAADDSMLIEKSPYTVDANGVINN